MSTSRSEPSAQSPDEVYDVVDAEDRVVGQATRREVHSRGLMHRAVHVLVFNSRRELFLQKRSMKKDENPGMWDTSAAGHVDSGESYDATARRELKEELNLDAEPVFLFKLHPRAETGWEHVQVYRCESDAAISCHPGEIEEGRFWPMDEVIATHQSPKSPFTGTFGIILSRLLETAKNGNQA